MSRIYRALLVVSRSRWARCSSIFRGPAIGSRTIFSAIFLAHALVLHPSFRGVVSGVGVLDILIAFGLDRHAAWSSSCPASVTQIVRRFSATSRTGGLFREPMNQTARSPVAQDPGGRCCGCRLDQIREKDLSGKECAAVTSRQRSERVARPLTRGRGTTRILVNDRLDVALSQALAASILVRTVCLLRKYGSLWIPEFIRKIS